MSNIKEYTISVKELKKLNQALTGSSEPVRTQDKTFSAYFNKDNTAYEAMFRLDDDGRMNYHYREVEEDPEFTMISFGAHAIDETKKAVNVFCSRTMVHAVACLEEMAIDDYWEWRQELGTDFDECSMRV
jgi:hypothetical protein